jgi:hypothetical protein
MIVARMLRGRNRLTQFRSLDALAGPLLTCASAAPMSAYERKADVTLPACWVFGLPAGSGGADTATDKIRAQGVLRPTPHPAGLFNRQAHRRSCTAVRPPRLQGSSISQQRRRLAIATALITSDITSAASRALLIGRIGKAQQIVDDYSCLMGADEVGTLRGLTERRTILDKLTGDYRGRIANTAGDSCYSAWGPKRSKCLIDFASAG